VKFELPKGWKAEPDGEVITVSTPDDSLSMVFWVPDEDSFDAAVNELDKELGKTIKNIKTTGAGKKDTHNGMPHFGQSGTGEVEGNHDRMERRRAWSQKTRDHSDFRGPGSMGAARAKCGKIHRQHQESGIAGQKREA
jgi:hypothetical protein